MSAFTHLAVRSEYSIVDSIVRIKSLVAAAAADGQTSLGLADIHNLFAVVKFYKACIASGIKPLLGTEMVVGEMADGSAYDQNHSVIVYAMDNIGYQALLKLSSKGYTHGLIDDIPIVTKADLFASKGLLVILTERSEIGSALKGAHPERAQKLLQEWHTHFGDRLYIGIKRTQRADEHTFTHNAIHQAHKLGIPLVAYNDVRFLQAQDFEAHEARVCIASGYKLNDTTRPRHYSEAQYFKSQEEMANLFADLPMVLDNTNAFASRCNVTLTLGINVLPAYPIPEGETTESYFKKLAFDGLYARLAKLYPEATRDDTWQATQKHYEERLNFELNTINQMGFPGYFLIVMDFIRWSKENGVPVGPGRGSGAGSLVAYSLNITDLDPIQYDLLFERFLNPERVSMPDFDVDFCIDGRDRVIDYVAQMYGRDAVSQIITFGTMAAKAVIRDVARVQGKSYGLGDKMSKMIPKKPGISLTAALAEEVQLKELLTNPDGLDYDDANEIWEMALKLEGVIRNTGKHAGGVLIAPGQISDFSALYCDSDGARMSQYDKDDVEAVGLVKFDFLGLRNLTVIKAGIDNINARLTAEGKTPLDLDDIPLDDSAVYDHLLKEAKTTAVFQLESAGMKKYLAKLRPTNIDDVIAMCALYRPGPLNAGMVDMYINRKHGSEKVSYDHTLLEPILTSTYGVIVYQEQVMQISQTLAGYTLGGADMLRRAMGKKKPEEMAQQRSIFVAGAKAQGIDAQLAEGVFNNMETFAEYGFNKSHSAAYGVLAYQTAYLKHYYPAEFLAAVLTSEMNNTDNVVFLIGDCKDNFGLTVLPPSVNNSQWHFVASDPTTVVYGLGAIKGVGESAVESIVTARRQGKFRDLYDFCNRVDIKKVGKRTLEALIKSGSFDDLAQSIAPDLVASNKPYNIRAGLWRQIPTAMQAAEQNRQNKESGTLDLFGEIDDGLSVAPALENVVWSDKERLTGEDVTLGLYLTGHPIDEYKAELQRYVKPVKLADLRETGYQESVWVAGLVRDVANFGNRVAVSLDDGSARIESSCYADKFTHLKHKLTVGEVVLLKLSVRKHEERLFSNITHALTVLEMRLQFIQSLNIKVHKNDTKTLQALLQTLTEQTAPNPHAEDDGRLPLALYIHDEYSIAKVKTNARLRLAPSDANLWYLKNLLHDNFNMSASHSGQ